MDLPQSRFADALAFIIRHPFGYNQLDILPNLPPPRTASAIPSVGQRMNMAVTVLTKRTSFCLSLPRITCIVWLAWLAGLGLMWATYRLRVMHPHFLPLVLLLAVQVFGCVVVVCAGVWGVLRGPQRARALSCLLLATAPLWLWAGHISYGMWRAHSHNIPMDPLVKMGAAGGAMLIDAQTRYSYPNRLQGQRVVMIYDRAADPERDVAAMDRHLKRMEELIGRKQKSKVHWIRGSALSLGGRYFQGIALGSVCDGLPIADDELTGVDRHEVAHFALHHHCGPDKHPPSILVEGWAETQTGHKAGSLALRAWKQKQRGVVFSLRELTNDDLYNRSHRLVYVQGGALVDYLLREYGGEVFYELFTTTCPETFAADCRRVLGVDLDELDRRYWSDVERQVIAMGDASRENPLRDVVLGEGVDQGAWEALVENYAATIEQRNELFRQVQMEIESTGHDYSEEGAKTIPSEKFILAFDGDCQRKMCEELGRIRVTVANPRQSFTLFKKTGEPEWNWRGHSDVPQFEYRSCYMYSLSRIYSLIQPYKRLKKLLLGPTPVVTSLERIEEDGQERIVVSFECQVNKPSKKWSKRGSLVFMSNLQCALHSAETHTRIEPGTDYTQSLEIEYDPRERVGVPIVRAIRSQIKKGDNELQYEYVTRIHRCEIVPTPEKEFTFAAFKVAPSEPRSWFDRNTVPWYVLTTWSGGALSILLGATIGGWWIMRRQ